MKNKHGIRVFTKRELIEKLNFTQDEAKLIMKYQKTFPELLQDGVEGFVIDGEMLCKQLAVKMNFNDWLLADRKDKNGNIKLKGKLLRYRMEENKDYKIGEPRSINNCKKPTNVIKLTLDCAKKIAMRQNNKMGDLVSDYFILMEKALRNYEYWTMVREPQKEGFKQLCKALDSQYSLTHEGKEIPRYIYSNEADMLNRALLGYPSKKVQQLLETKDKQTREHFDTQINKALSELQMMDIGLMMAGLDYNARKVAIKNICDTKNKNIQLIVKELKEAA